MPKQLRKMLKNIDILQYTQWIKLISSGFSEGSALLAYSGNSYMIMQYILIVGFHW